MKLWQMINEAQTQQQRITKLLSSFNKTQEEEVKEEVEDSLDDTNQFLCIKMTNTNIATFQNSLVETRLYKEQKKQVQALMKISFQGEQIQFNAHHSFEDILVGIQEQYEKNLSEKGIKKIVKKIQQKIEQMSQSKVQDKENNDKGVSTNLKKSNATYKNNCSSKSSYSSKYRSKKLIS